MKNLAGDKDCDGPIELELIRCGIEVVRDQPRDGEVPSSLRGALGKFSFRRAWYYWMVNGKVPLAMANELYEDPVGRTDIRVNGHCGCPAPGEPGVISFGVTVRQKRSLWGKGHGMSSNLSSRRTRVL